ncbi:MAG: carboxypeptidase regulatory-like domain-containing protein, partial [Pirellulales bacterium]|nr:carboxypeptidase regulatory-like domain-containing protein [Pirellulales bacterium]
GTYTVVEVHPAGWLDGKDTPGNLGGTAAVSPPGDSISQVTINWGQAGTEYNFGELLPGSIAGRVIVCDESLVQAGQPIPDVQIDLLNGNGVVIATTTTNANGEYQFTNLRPGIYSVREHQPVQYFDDESHLGSGGGIVVSTNELGTIPIGSSQHLVHYDFCELPPAELSGYVYIDGAPIVTDQLLSPEEIAALRNGARTADDTPLAGVTLELRNGLTGVPILVGNALPGTYAGAAADPIRVVTDANGYYHFGGLRGGIYAVVEVQPSGVVDNVDTPGTLGGFATNPNGLLNSGIPTPSEETLIEQFRVSFGSDVILAIPLVYGQHGEENNFSEVTFSDGPPFVPPPPPPEEPPPPVFGPPAIPVTPPLPYVPLVPPRKAPDIFGGSSVVGYTWHLSVVNAGWPRSMEPAEVKAMLASTQLDLQGWKNVPMDQARWTLATLNGNQVEVLRDELFGTSRSTPVTGDFNGDGVTDIAVFIEGKWFIDLNGNGKWDEGDLWAELGTEDDSPITGDWDADGKTDIGIYGPAWMRDPWAIEHEPGLPDADNIPTVPLAKMKNMPPTAEEATSGARLLKRTALGITRADVIDHVFHYGQPLDTPVAGDWNGDGIRQIGVYRDGQWVLDTNGDGRFTETDTQAVFGQAGDLPVVGDFNRDGVDEIGVFRAGRWIVDTNANRQIDAQDKVFELGGAGDLPVVGDWNDDGADDPGIFQPTAAATDRVSRRAS